MITTNVITSSTDWMRTTPSVQAVRRALISQSTAQARKSRLVTILTQKGNPI